MSKGIWSGASVLGAIVSCLATVGRASAVVVEVSSSWHDADKWHVEEEPCDGPSWRTNLIRASDGPTHDPGEDTSDYPSHLGGGSLLVLPDRSDWMAAGDNMMLSAPTRYPERAYMSGLTGTFEHPWEATSGPVEYTFDDAGFPHYWLDAVGAGWLVMAKDSTKFSWASPLDLVIASVGVERPASIGIYDGSGTGRFVTVYRVDTGSGTITAADPSSDCGEDGWPVYTYTVSSASDISVSYGGQQQDLRYVCSFDDVTWWMEGTGNWGTAGNWSGALVPTSSRRVFLGLDNTGTITVDADAAAGMLVVAGPASLRLGGGKLVVGTQGIRCDGAIEVLDGGRLETEVLYVGHTGTGTVTHSGGTVKLEGLVTALSVGSGPGSEGFYYLSGSGVVDCTGHVEIGGEGSGTFVQTGGSLKAGLLMMILEYGGTLEIRSGGTYRISGGSVDVFRINVAGTLEIADPGCDIMVDTLLEFRPGGSLEAVPGSAISMDGADFVNESRDPAAFAGLSSLALVFSGTWSDFQVGGRDMGLGSAGFDNNFALGTLQIGTADKTGKVRLRDWCDNQPASVAAEVQYVDELVLQHQSRLETNGLGIYAGEVSVDANSRIDLQGGAFAVSGNVESLLDGWIGTRIVDSSLSALTQLYAVYDPVPDWTGVWALPKPEVQTRWQHAPATAGDWFESGNWTGAVPDTSHVGIIDNGGTAEISGGAAGAGELLYLGYDLGGSGSVGISGEGQLTAETQYVGYHGTGNVSQTAGGNTVGEDLYLGHHYDGEGTYELGGTGHLQAEREYVAYHGAGSFVQTGGLNESAYLHVAPLAGSHGTYEHSAGENKVTESMTLGGDPAAEGVYVLSGTGELNVRENEWIGAGGTFIHTGGTNTAESLAVMGAPPDGAYRLSGTGFLHIGEQWIGGARSGEVPACEGSFVHTGGTNDASRLYVGCSRGCQGSYELSGGTLDSYIEYVGYEGTGTLLQTSGTNSVALCLYVGYEAEGTFYLSGGELSCGTSIQTRGEYIGTHAPGTFLHSGGTNTFHRLRIGWADEGTYVLSGTGRMVGDEVIVGNVSHSAPGTFVRMGGVIDVDKFVVTAVGTYIHGSGAETVAALGIAGWYELTGDSQLTSDNGYIGRDLSGVLEPDDEDYGACATDSATGLFLQTGGTFIVTNSLVLGSEEFFDGVYSISAGNLTAGDLMVGGLGHGWLKITDADANVRITRRLCLGDTSSLTVVSGGAIHMTGSAFENHSTDPVACADLANLTLVFEGGPGELDSFEVAGEDRGPAAAGFEENFGLGTLQLGGEAGIGRVRLVDCSDNRPDWEGSEALYVGQLAVGGGSSLELNALNLYAEILSIEAAGVVDLEGAAFCALGNVEALLDGWTGGRLVDSTLPAGMRLDAAYDPVSGWTQVFAVPEPGTLLLLVAAGACLLIRACRRRGQSPV